MNRRHLIALVALLAVAWGTTMALGAEAKPTGKCPDGMKMVLTEITKTADGYLVEMRKKLGESFTMLEDSLAKGKQSQIQAQNEAITSMKALVKLSEQDNVNLKEAAAKKNKDEASHQLTKICLSSKKVDELFNQVKSAGGVVDVIMTEVERTMEHRPSLPVSQALVEAFETVYGDDTAPPEEFISPTG